MILTTSTFDRQRSLVRPSESASELSETAALELPASDLLEQFCPEALALGSKDLRASALAP